MFADDHPRIYLNRNRARLEAAVAANGPAYCAGADLNWMKRMAGYTQSYSDAMVEQILSDAEADEVWLQLRANREIRRIQADRASAAGFHDHLMAGWSPSQRRCPWLEKGLYVDRAGYATPCCMVKDRSQALGQLAGARGVGVAGEDLEAAGQQGVAGVGADVAEGASEQDSHRRGR